MIMKYLLILLFLFSTQSFSGEIDGKFIICKYLENKYSKIGDYIYGYAFGNSKAMKYGININHNANAKYEVILISTNAYQTNANIIKIPDSIGETTIDRKSLKLKFRDKLFSTCELISSEVIFVNTLAERRDELNEIENKKREGNKI